MATEGSHGQANGAPSLEPWTQLCRKPGLLRGISQQVGLVLGSEAITGCSCKAGGLPPYVVSVGLL